MCFDSFQIFTNKATPSKEESEYITSFSHLLEVIYDPFLTWRNFIHGSTETRPKKSMIPIQLHVELVPFIYGNYTEAQNYGRQEELQE